MIYKHIKHFACGFVMGTADIIPGVSGGTMAWVMGIYQRLIGVIAAVGTPLLPLLFKGQWRQIAQRLDLGFMLALFAGMLCAIVCMVKLVGLPALMKAHPEPVYGLFFGLIVGSVWLLMRHKVQLRYRFAYLLCGAAMGWGVVNLVPTATPDTALVLFGCGVLAISAMLLPGISGSFILLILGKYSVILQAISDADAAVLLPFVAGCVAGLMVFSRLLRMLLARFHDAMLWLMSGLLLGTLWVIWPFQQRQFAQVNGKEKLLSSSPVWPADINGEAMLAAALALFGLVLVVGLERLKAKG